MSYQIKNKLTLHQKKFGIIKTTNDGLIIPEDFGMKARYNSSILMRGYITYYIVDVNSNLLLQNFYINVNMNDDFKSINGKFHHISSKTDIKSGTTRREYRNLNFSVSYSGYILIGDQTLKGLDKKYRLHGAEYEEVFELQVEKGKVIAIKNLSKKMLQHRMKYKDGDWGIDLKNLQFDDDIQKWVFKDITEF